MSPRRGSGYNRLYGLNIMEANYFSYRRGDRVTFAHCFTLRISYLLITMLPPLPFTEGEGDHEVVEGEVLTFYLPITAAVYGLRVAASHK